MLHVAFNDEKNMLIRRGCGVVKRQMNSKQHAASKFILQAPPPSLMKNIMFAAISSPNGE